MKRSNCQSKLKQITVNFITKTWSILFCVYALFAGNANARADDDVPLPPEYLVFQKAMDTVNSANKLTVEDKRKLQDQHDKIQAQFQKVWASLNTVYIECKSELADNTARGQVHNQQGEILEREKASVDRTDEGAVAAFNQQADAYNAEKNQLEQERTEILDKWKQKAEETQAWIDSSRMKAFVDTVHAKLFFYYGPAYYQLLGIHDGTLDWDGRKR